MGMETEISYMPDVPRRGRPKTGRKTVYQTGLDDDAEGAEVERIVEAEGMAASAVIRELVIEGLEARKKKPKR